MSENIEYFYSKVLPKEHPQALLHLVVRGKYFDEIGGRSDIIDPRHFLQVAFLNLAKDQTFKAHRHIYSKFFTESKISNEMWYIIRGSVQADYWDLDGSKLNSVILSEGDITITISAAGHNYTSLTENTRVIEIKSGPYFSREQDKVPL